MAASVVQSDDFIKQSSHSRAQEIFSIEKVENVENQEVDLSVKCRGCFVEEPEMHYLFTIFDQSLSLADILMENTGFECKKDDGYPPYLCSKCTSALIDFFNFKIHFKQTQAYIQNLLSQIEDKLETSSTSDNKDDTLEPLPEPEQLEQTHLNLQDVPEQTKCTSCNITYIDAEECVTHRAQHHGINPFERYGHFREMVLKQERALFDAKKAESVRRQEELNNAPGKLCRLCRVKLPEDQFDDHWETHKIHVCEVCGFKFIKRFHMLQHMKTVHTTDRVYECNVCQKTFKTSTCKNRHMVLHNNPRSFCCEVCGQTFNSMNTLRVHNHLRHVGSRDFICHICNMAFPLKNTLDKHLVRHNLNRIPEFVCELCKAAFRDRSSLKRHHLIKHTDEFVRPQCKICLKTYCSTSKLKTHIARHHTDGAYERKKKGPKRRPLFVFEDEVGEVEIGYSSEEEKVYKLEPEESGGEDVHEEKRIHSDDNEYVIPKTELTTDSETESEEL